MTGIIRAVCLSNVKGTGKAPVKEAVFIEDYGIEGDAHAGKWHRQVSLLSYDKIKKFNESGASVQDGDFGENLVVEGIDFRSLSVGTRLHIRVFSGGHRGDVILEMTQIGKDCHYGCAIKQRMGSCIMPSDGVFARVIKGGTVRKGDLMDVESPFKERPFTAAVITVSDRCAAGECEDLSGPLAERMLKDAGYEVSESQIISDDFEKIKSALIRFSDVLKVDLIVTSGGTGFSPRDHTPEATMASADRDAPGIAEAIRVKALAVTDRAMLGRGRSVIRKQTLIVNLPGSPKAVREGLEVILGPLQHGLGILRGIATD